ncbi:hypothetical protein LJC46_04230 [Desulfovibrio sp. OttesenSCG-928-G15]|nr:hypothetical protein [Desulfovibrio sp. OttesenSCG-928-G15]
MNDGSGLPTIPNANASPQALELEIQRDKHQYDFAVKNLDATLENNKDMREKFNASRKHSLLFAGIASGLAFIIIMTALFLDKDAFIADMVKILVGALGGAGAGYMSGYRRGRLEQSQQKQ